MHLQLTIFLAPGATTGQICTSIRVLVLAEIWPAQWHRPVTEILVRQKFWSGRPKFLENWSAGPLFSENFGPRVELWRVELWSQRKYFGVSTLTTHVCGKVSV